MSKEAKTTSYSFVIVLVFMLCYPLLMFRLLSTAYGECKTKAEYIGSTVFTAVGLVLWFGLLWLSVWIARAIL